jgi:hypothetical protein
MTKLDTKKLFLELQSIVLNVLSSLTIFLCVMYISFCGVFTYADSIIYDGNYTVNDNEYVMVHTVYKKYIPLKP